MAKRNTNGSNGAHGDGSATWQKVAVMRAQGVEQTLGTSGRVVRLRAVEPAALLRKGNVPDILTPLLIKSVYQPLDDPELREFLDTPLGKIEDALAMADTLDLIASVAIADGTKVEELSLSEKRWIFRLVLSPAEFLVTFRYQPLADVELVDESEALPQAAE